MRAYESRRRSCEFINESKQAPCADCGLEWPPYVMQFHHVRGPKLFNVANAPGRYSRARIEAEIEKCVLLCSNCHAIRHHDTPESAQERV